ncbi:phosphoribosylanthranilate isomerase [Chakrabartyella piscis]|uniref:phosphoribosylanthranilate isomerase n=1 Tax=Chakrabartyella piscis TaxID=2918914 RepID=UPI002958B857|nr:phosphoribosylanthranilate isomerase [Chakrabartyella piscis]
MTKVKICGLKRPEDISYVNQYKPDYIGFVFAKSKRQVTKELAQSLQTVLLPEMQAVGVFVNHSIEEIVDLVEENIIQVVQLHGKETAEYIAELQAKIPNTPLWKAVSVKSIEDILAWEDSKVDLLLLDNGAGGTGEVFDWNILKEMKNFPKPYFIAGGLNPENVSEVLQFASFGVDVSGGVETDGCKDEMKIKSFIETVRNR